MTNGEHEVLMEDEDRRTQFAADIAAHYLAAVANSAAEAAE